MTGWRLGYAVAPKQLIDAMDLLVLNTFTCTAEFTQVAAIEALADSTNAVDAMVAEYRKRRDLFVTKLNADSRFSLPDARRRVLCLGEYRRHRAAGGRSCEGSSRRSRSCGHRRRGIRPRRAELSALFAGERSQLAGRSTRANRARVGPLARRMVTLRSVPVCKNPSFRNLAPPSFDPERRMARRRVRAHKRNRGAEART